MTKRQAGNLNYLISEYGIAMYDYGKSTKAAEANAKKWAMKKFEELRAEIQKMIEN